MAVAINPHSLCEKKRYTLDDIEKIKYSNITFKLNNDVLEKIKQIATEVGSPEYIKTPQFPKKDKFMRKKGRNKTDVLSAEDWNKIRAFKATVIKKDEGTEANINKIRQHLNKISEKTYDILQVKIFDEISIVINKCESSDKLQLIQRISSVIFDIASSNAFYSTLYAKFYKSLLEHMPEMKSIFMNTFSECLQLFENIENIDPAKDYNRFCEVNKTNEKRRAVIKFYVNLMNINVISTSNIFDIIFKIKEKIELELDDINHVCTVDELAELLKIIIIDGHTLLKNEASWDDIKNHIDIMAGTTASSKAGLSNKTVFKYMDIQDALK